MCKFDTETEPGLKKLSLTNQGGQKFLPPFFPKKDSIFISSLTKAARKGDREGLL